MIIIDKLHFRFIEDVGFRLMMLICCLPLNMPSCITIARDIYHIHANEIVKLREYLTHSCQRVCVTTNTWISLQRINYVVVTTHFIDNDWKLHNKYWILMQFLVIKVMILLLLLESVLKDWGLASKLYTIIIVNARSNNTTCTTLVGDFKWHGHFLFFGGKFLHVRYVVHMLNLVACDGLKIARKLVKHFYTAMSLLGNP